MMWKLPKFLNREIIKERNYPRLCVYPFFNMMLTADGKYKPCCKWTDNLKDYGRELTTEEDSLIDAFYSSDMQDLRARFLNGQIHPACQVCLEEEGSGILSMRLDSFDYLLKKEILKNPHLKRLDLYISNICNLKCRICSATYSSKWIKEAQETLGQEAETHHNLTDANLDDIRKVLPEIIELGLFGGEPMYNQETLEILTYCVENGYSKNIQLLINTNGTIYNEQWVTILQSFKKVLLNFSLDDIDKRFDYQRKGAVWEKVRENILNYLKISGFQDKSKIESKICCTISIFNIYYIPEIIERFERDFPGMHIYFNFLHGPYALSIKNLPIEVKRIIKQKLRTIVINNSIRKVHNRTIQNIYDFLDISSNVPFQAFFDEMRRGDQYRKENFELIFPEFWTIIKNFEVNKNNR